MLTFITHCVTYKNSLKKDIQVLKSNVASNNYLLGTVQNKISKNVGLEM